MHTQVQTQNLNHRCGLALPCLFVEKKLKNGAEVRFYFFNNKETLRRNVHIHIKQQHEGAA